MTCPKWSCSTWARGGRRPLATWRACTPLAFRGLELAACREYVRTYDQSPGSTPTYALGCYQFVSGVSPCPICAKPAGHKNGYLVLYGKESTRHVLNMSATCVRGGRELAWTDEGRLSWRSVLGEKFAPECNEAPCSLPLEAHLYATCVRALNPAWTMGKAFEPNGDFTHSGLIVLTGQDGAARLLGLRPDGGLEVGTKQHGESRYTWRPLPPAAQSAADCALAGWFAARFPAVRKDASGLFEAPCCAVVCGNEPSNRKRHMGCVPPTTRPWTMLPALAAHLRLRAGVADGV